MSVHRRDAEIVRKDKEQFKLYVASKGYTWGKVPAHETWSHWFYLFRFLRSKYHDIPKNARLLATGFIGGDPQLPAMTPVEQFERLAPWALDDLRRSGLTDDYINACRTYWPETDGRVIAAWMRKRKLYHDFDSSTYRQIRDCGPWMRIDYANPARAWQSTMIRYKPQVPWITARGRAAKYLTAPRTRSRLYVPTIGATAAHYRNGDVDAWITEGEKKADAANMHGFVCVAIPGVWGWVRRVLDHLTTTTVDRDVMPDLIDIFQPGRRINLAFDSDLAHNTSVQEALSQLADIAHYRFHCDVRNVRLPGRGPGGVLKVGLDDFLIEHGPDELRKLAAETDPPAAHRPEWQIAGVGRCPQCYLFDHPCEACRRRYLARPWLDADPATRGDPPELPGHNCPNKVPRRMRNILRVGLFGIIALDCGSWRCDVCRAKKVFNRCVHFERRVYRSDGTQKLGTIYNVAVREDQYRGLVHSLSNKKIKYYAIADQVGFYHIFTDATFKYRPRPRDADPNAPPPSPIIPTPLAARAGFNEFVRRMNALGSWVLRSRQKPIRRCRAWAFEDTSIKSKQWEIIANANPDLDHYDWRNIAETLAGQAVQYPGSKIDKSGKYGRYRRVESYWRYSVPKSFAAEFEKRVSLATSPEAEAITAGVQIGCAARVEQAANRLGRRATSRGGAGSGQDAADASSYAQSARPGPADAQNRTLRQVYLFIP